MTTRVEWTSGCATALVTPFKKDGSVDEECFTSLVERQIKAGVRLLVPCGTTGESVTMSEAERLNVIKLTVAAAKGRKACVIAGTGSNNTSISHEKPAKPEPMRRWSSRRITTNPRRKG
jgi:4-hydroxy-tetrahydrodipicolinate synthase